MDGFFVAKFRKYAHGPKIKLTDEQKKEQEAEKKRLDKEKAKRKEANKEEREKKAQEKEERKQQAAEAY